MEKPIKKIDYQAIEREFARAFEKSLNALGERSSELSWFCTTEEYAVESEKAA